MNTQHPTSNTQPGPPALRPPRDLKCTLSFEEFGAVQWAANHTPHLLPDGRVGKCTPLAEFFRRALMQAVREVARTHSGRGKSIPPDIAATVDRTRSLAIPIPETETRVRAAQCL